jgi:UDP-GlcNAc:undecaprenyl-phosphate GlcNAc-1-phosphate transferase
VNGALAIAMPIAAGIGVSVAATFPLRRLAVRLGILDRPKPGSYKVHHRAIPYLGGVAILLGTAASLLAHPHHYLGLLALVTIVAVLGLIDDIFHASVAFKLLTEAAVAVVAIELGFLWQLTDSAAINWALTLLWIVGLTNSFNLLDNMDGLAATIGATALLGLALINPMTTPLAVGLGAALIGFLLVNWPPARMFMGDCGSLQVGFVAAIATITAANSAHGLHSVVLLAAPVALGLLDTSLVIASRLINGRPVQLGGRDHFSHRLLLLGWPRPAVLGAAFGATAASIAIAYLAGLYPLAGAWLAIPPAVLFAAAWLRLLRIDPYTAQVNSKPEVLSA